MTKRNTNLYLHVGDMTLLILRSGHVVYVSTESVPKIRDYTWCIEGTGYVMSATKGKAVKLHRIITDAPRGKFVDHRDGDPLNNTLDNLRICSKKQNEYNSKTRADNSSGYRGVCLINKNGKYRAYITKDGKQTSLGVFSDKHAAAKAYNSAAEKLFGEFARLNKISEVS